MKTRSIGRKLLRIHVIASALALLVINGALIGLVWQSSRGESLQRLGVEAVVVGRNCAAALAFQDAATANKHLAALRAVPGVLHGAVYDEKGHLFASFGDVGGPVTGADLVAAEDSIRQGVLRVTRPLFSGDERVGFIIATASSEPINAVALRYGLAIAVMGAAAVALGALLMARLARAITSPIMELANVTQDIARTGDYTRRATLQRDDELGTLALGFDFMIATVQQRDVELAQHRAHLEQMIRERTNELAQSNEQLWTELTERQRAQQNLVVAAREWRATFDAISDGLCILSEDGRVLRCNRALAVQLGLPPVKVVGRSLYELNTTVGGPARELQQRLRTARRKVTEVYEAQGRWLEYTMEPFDGENAAVGDAALVIADVTEQRQLLDQLGQSQKMEAIGRLAGGVAHDFNNILAIIQTCATMLKRSVAKDSPAHEDLDEIVHAVARATDLTRQLLAFSRKQVLQVQTLAVNDAIAASAKMFTRLLGADMKLETSLAPTTTLVRMDPTQLDQVVLNLVVNARDAMQSGGKIVIETSEVTAPEGVPVDMRAQLEPGRYAAISVRDTGSGIKPEVLAHIFEPFFTTKAKGKGTGLGLATVYGVARQNGGAIHVQSTVGAGSTFTVYLKAAEATAAVATQAQANEPVLRGADERILLVEDDDQVRRAVGKLLTEHGYRITEADNGVSGLTRFSASPSEFDLVLTDIIMPGQSGVAMVDAIRAIRPDVPVLFMSAYSDEARDDTRFPDASLLVAKPFTDEVLLKRLRERLAASA